MRLHAGLQQRKGDTASLAHALDTSDFRVALHPAIVPDA
jgi:hypothetical protein